MQDAVITYVEGQKSSADTISFRRDNTRVPYMEATQHFNTSANAEVRSPNATFQLQMLGTSSLIQRNSDPNFSTLIIEHPADFCPKS